MIELPRIENVEPHGASALRIRWKGKRAYDAIELIGWIATGGDVLAPLRNAATFAKVAPSDYGAAVSWDDGEGDLSIDAVHLKKLADEQRPFSNNEVCAWQAATNISNNEAADFVGVSLSTWNTYRTDARIPQAVAVMLRASRRDPLLMQAHLRPRTTGRPRKAG